MDELRSLDVEPVLERFRAPINLSSQETRRRPKTGGDGHEGCRCGGGGRTQNSITIALLVLVVILFMALAYAVARGISFAVKSREGFRCECVGSKCTVHIP